MNKKTIALCLIIVIAMLLTKCTTPPATNKSQSAAIVMATATLPPENDIFLNPNSVYTNYNVTKSGTPDNPVVVWGNGATIQCSLVQADYVVIRDLIVKNCNTFGIRVNGKHIKILNNDVSDVVKSNKLISGKCDDSSSASWHSVIRAADSSDIVISGNKVSQSCGEGISILRADNVLVENNIVFDTFSVNIYCDQCSNSVIRNNYSYSTGDLNYYKAGKVARGIMIGAELYSGWAYSVHDILIENNILERVRGINYYQEQAGTPSNVVVRNNVFLNVPAPLLSLGSWATVANNITATPGISTPVTPTVPASATASRTASPTALQPPTATKTFTPTALPPTVTKTFTPAVVPTVCETAVSNSYWFMGCTK